MVPWVALVCLSRLAGLRAAFARAGHSTDPTARRRWGREPAPKLGNGLASCATKSRRPSGLRLTQRPKIRSMPHYSKLREKLAQHATNRRFWACAP